jgi:hypothetical protein
VTFVRTQTDRALAVGAALVGLVLLGVGWYGVSGQGVIAGQIPYVVSCGLGGLFAIGVAATLWISADLRDEWRKLGAVEVAITAQNELLETLRREPLLSAEEHEVIQSLVPQAGRLNGTAATTTPSGETTPPLRATRSRRSAVGRGA